MGVRGERGTVKVESGIYRREGGTYAVEVSANHSTFNKSFPTLKEARAYKQEVINSRKKREKRIYRRATVNYSAEETATRDAARALLKDAPRSKVKRDGRDFTLVKLPPDPRIRDLRDPESLGEVYLWMRRDGASIEEAVNARTLNYEDGPYMSSDPAFHHSGTSQTIGVLDDGGAL